MVDQGLIVVLVLAVARQSQQKQEKTWVCLQMSSEHGRLLLVEEGRVSQY